jgi:hypothetical protein
MMMPKILPFAILSMLCCSAISCAKAQNYTPACIGFYNVENLFDTLDTPDVNDTEYTPQSAKQWNTARYNQKLTNLARVIGEMGTDVHPDGLIAVGLSEVENRAVMQDLVNTAPLKVRGYEIVHYDSPDRRGIDVGLIYQPKYFKVFNHKSYTLKIVGDEEFASRDQLVVSGVLDTDTVHILVAHWPSRRGGEKRSSPLRQAAADLGRSIIDSLLTINPKARIMYMGDLNDDPTNLSVKRNLRTEAKPENALNGRLYNPMEELFNKGIGTLAWRDTWNLFDQIIISEGLATAKDGGYRYFGAKVHNKPYLRQQEGNFAGYPYRMYVGDTYRNGFSDHFPVYLILVKEVTDN